jgi:glycosyltransferase involved in cell wall biosynthesis
VTGARIPERHYADRPGAELSAPLPAPEPAERPPRVSVVVPTWRRPQLLARCLEALLRQTLPAGDYEIIVADDGVDESTLETVTAANRDGGPRVVYVPVLGSHGPAAARNCGWSSARAPVVAFTDDDTIPCSRWLEEGLAALRPGMAAVAGRIRMAIGPRPRDYEKDAAGLAQAEFATANCFVDRAALTAIGGFDERFRLAWREDSDLQFSLLARGGIIGTAPRAVVTHPVRPAPWGISLRQQRKVYFDALLYRKHPRLYRSRIRSAPRWDYYVTVAALLAVPAAWSAGAPVAAAAAAAVWLLFTAAFSIQRLRGTSHRPRHVAEIVVTSAAIPPLATFWRLAGAWHFRVPFF